LSWDCFNVLSINYNVIKYCNSIDIIVLLDNVKYQVTGIYRSPNYNVELLNDSLDIFHFLTMNNYNKCHKCDDININILSNNLFSINYINIIS